MEYHEYHGTGVMKCHESLFVNTFKAFSWLERESIVEVTGEGLNEIDTPTISWGLKMVIHWYSKLYMGVSENSVPLNPMVNDHYPY